MHRCFGCPSLSTFLRAIRAGWLRSIPNLTAALVSRNPPLAPETALGHLDTVRQGLRSTRSPDPVTALLSSHPALLSDDISQLPPLSFTVTPRRDWAGADLTGRFPVKSRRLNEYILITVFKGYIHAEPMPTKSAASYLKAYTSTITFFHSRGHTITHLTIDNEFSSDLDSYFRSPSVSVTVQFQPPSNHRTNFAERAIRTFKNHMIATLSSVHTQFPLDLWDQLLPHIELTLNHLRPFHGNPSISAHHGIHANPVDFLAHPLHPPGQLVVVHESPDARASWATHGLRGYYLGPALSHYRCHHVHILKTGSPRISDTLSHYPNPLFHFESPHPPPPLPPPCAHRPNPTPDGSDLIGRYFVDPDLGVCKVTAVGEPFLLRTGAGNRAAAPFLPAGYHPTLVYTMSSGHTHSSSLTEVSAWIRDLPASPQEIASHGPPTPPPRRTPRVRTPTPTPTPPTVSARAPPAAPPPTARELRALARHRVATAALCHRASQSPNLLRCSPSVFALAASHAARSTGAHRLPSTGAPIASKIPHTTPATITTDLNPADDLTVPVLNLDPHGNPLSYTSAIAGLNQADWLTADIKELFKLITDTRTLKPLLKPLKKPTYYNRVVKEKWNAVTKSIDRRVRGTAGGDRLSCNYNISSSVASLVTVKILLNAVVSENKLFATIDLTDFYLGADLPEPEYIKIYTDTYSPSVLSQLGITDFIHTDSSGKSFCYFAINKSMYGLKNAGRVSKDRLVKHLNSSNFFETNVTGWAQQYHTRTPGAERQSRQEVQIVTGIKN